MTEPYTPEALKSARVLYYQWLLRRFGHNDLGEIADSTDPVDIQRIYVPLRLSDTVIEEEQMPPPATVADRKGDNDLPGKDAAEVIASQPFVMISGKPGSGKSTLVHWIVSELCGQRPSRLRRQLISIQGSIAPVPLVLRNIPDLSAIKDLDSLFAAWLKLMCQQAADCDIILDQAKLQQSFFSNHESIPCLLLFDGMDEVGGRDVRQRVLELARTARKRGYRVLLTSRPEGISDLAASSRADGMLYADGQIRADGKLPCYYIAPLAWSQIRQFIDHWYQLRDDWKRRQRKDAPRFLAALREHQQYLLPLARRPIFITLMALIHCTRNEMPQGQVALYDSIVDIYLDRQEKHRQRKNRVDGKALAHWPHQEKRLALSWLAWRTQQLSETGQCRSWQTATIQKALAEAIAGKTPEKLRFTVLRAEDAEALLACFLHPAGLLVAPTNHEIQFAHLSFQSFLCAEFIVGHIRPRTFERDLHELLFSHLQDRGWHDIALLALGIQAEKNQNLGHLDMLALLDVSKRNQAALLVDAVCNPGLPFTRQEQKNWLPLLIMVVLQYPEDDLASPMCGLADEGLPIVKQLLAAPSAETQWADLQEQLKHLPPAGLDEANLRQWCDHCQQLWLKRSAAQRMAALLNMLLSAGWGMQDDTMHPLADDKLEELLARWLDTTETEALWTRDEHGLPQPTLAQRRLEELTPRQGMLQRTAARHFPLDARLLHDHMVDSWLELCSFPSTLLIFDPDRPSTNRSEQLFLFCHQLMMVAETMVCGKHYAEFAARRAKSALRSLPPCDARLQSRAQTIAETLLPPLTLTWPRSLAVLRSNDFSSLKTTRNQLTDINEPQSLFLMRALSLLLSPDSPFKDEQAKKLGDIADDLRNKALVRPAIHRLNMEMECFLANWLAFSWLEKQSSLLPKIEGIVESDALCAEQQRKHWQGLRQKLNDFASVASELFADLSPSDNEYQHLEQQFSQLQACHWSPYALLDAFLNDWPTQEPSRHCSLEASQQRLMAACQHILDPDTRRIHARR